MNAMVPPVGGQDHGSCASGGVGEKRAPIGGRGARGELDRLRILNAELQHRLFNIYAIVNSVADRSARHCTTLEDFLPVFQSRLAVLARLQTAMFRSPTDPDLSLYEMVTGEIYALAGVNGGDDRITLDGSRSLAVAPRAGEIVALGIHELATNSCKYGVLFHQAGHIHVSWRRLSVAGADFLRLEWGETGIATEAPPKERRGFGSELIGLALPRQLGAATTYRIDASGVHCTIDIPAHLIRDAGQPC
jgi:two-component system CheB/CheR fusion protein